MALREHPGGWQVTAERRVTYDIHLCDRVLDAEDPSTLLDHDRPPPRRLAVVDAGVQRLYGDRISAWLDRMGTRHDVLTIAPGEATKARATVDQIHEAAFSMGLGRRDELLAIGGGIVLDLVGVAADELRKGTPYTIIPTTLVGLIDAGLGTKRAINQLGRKNVIGGYHPARRALLDPGFLATLDQRELAAGFAEIKKVGEMVDPTLLDLLDQHGPDLIATALDHPAAHEVLRRSISGILGHLAADPYEGHLRRWPDHGHTISPALEMETRGAVLHGEAVGICSLLGATLAAGRGYVDATYPERMVSLTRRLGLPLYHALLDDPAFLRRAVAGATLTRGGHQHWPVPSSNAPTGHTFIQDATPAEVAAAAQALGRLSGALR